MECLLMSCDVDCDALRLGRRSATREGGSRGSVAALPRSMIWIGRLRHGSPT